MSRLAAEVAGLFAGLDGYERYAVALEVTGAQRRADAVERTRLWRIMNPAKFRAQRNRNRRRWEARNPDKYKAAKASYRERHREHVRKVNTRNQKKRRDRLVAAGLTAKGTPRKRATTR